MSRTKKRLFMSITAALPFVLFILLESGLRLFHYGPDLSLFVTETIGGQTYYRMNPEVKDRYFSRFPFTPTTSMDYFVVPKPKGIYRIFCLGGSTTVGYPYWYNGSFSSFLRDRLHSLFPGKSFEIINCGITATNSFTVNDIAAELIEDEPDLFIVYDGHNEFYGALGAASHESVGDLRWLTKLYLRMIHLRTFLLIRDAATGITDLFHTSPVPAAAGTMMERLARGQYIPYGNSTYQHGLSDFKDNLGELKSLCGKHSVSLLIASQVSNLRDQFPFVSESADDEPAPGQTAAKHWENVGLTHWQQGHIDSARMNFQKAIEADSLRADVHYLFARCLDTAGEKTGARREYIKARDYDELRFRASSDINNIIRSICDDSLAIFVDMEQIFQINSPDSLIGRDLIVEHLHPNSHGYFLMGKAFADAMQSHALLASPVEWREREPLSEAALWDQRSLTDLDESVARRRTDVLTAGWPFKNQTPIVDPVDKRDTLGQIAEKVTRGRLDWVQAHQSAAEYYAARRDTAKLECEYRVLMNQVPHEVTPYLQLAHLLLQKGRFGEVQKLLLHSLEVTKTILAYRALGDIALNNGTPNEAVDFYRGTFKFDQSPREQVENGYLLAVALIRSGKRDEARAQLLKILKINPAYQPGAELLAKINSAK